LSVRLSVFILTNGEDNVLDYRTTEVREAVEEEGLKWRTGEPTEADAARLFAEERTGDYG
jgi:hypothetical protein